MRFPATGRVVTSTITLLSQGSSSGHHCQWEAEVKEWIISIAWSGGRVVSCPTHKHTPLPAFKSNSSLHYDYDKTRIGEIK